MRVKTLAQIASIFLFTVLAIPNQLKADNLSKLSGTLHLGEPNEDKIFVFAQSHVGKTVDLDLRLFVDAGTKTERTVFAECNPHLATYLVPVIGTAVFLPIGDAENYECATSAIVFRDSNAKQGSAGTGLAFIHIEGRYFVGRCSEQVDTYFFESASTSAVSKRCSPAERNTMLD